LLLCSDDERTDTQLPLLVTAAVGAIHLRRRLDLHKDVQVSGQVVWTGKSAMDIRMQLTQVQLNHVMLAADFHLNCLFSHTALWELHHIHIF